MQVMAKNFVVIQAICYLNFMLYHLFTHLMIILGYAILIILICDIQPLCQFDAVIPIYGFFLCCLLAY